MRTVRPCAHLGMTKAAKSKYAPGVFKAHLKMFEWGMRVNVGSYVGLLKGFLSEYFCLVCVLFVRV